MNFLFWNAGKHHVDTELAELIVSTQANFVAIAEYAGDGFDILRLLAAKGTDYYTVPSIACERIKIFTDFSPSVVKHIGIRLIKSSFALRLPTGFKRLH